MSKPDPDAPVPGPEQPAPADAPADRVDLRKADAPAAPEEVAPPADPWAAPAAAPPAKASAADVPQPADAPPGQTDAPAPADPWAAPAGAPPLAPPPPPGGAAGGWASVPPGAYSGFQPGYPYPQPPKRTNGFAIAALVTGLVCAWPVALVLSIVAMVQIRKRDERGMGMAVTGLVFGTFGVMITAFGFLGAMVAPDPVNGAAPKAPAGSVRWSALKSGDCFSTPDGGARTDPDGGDDTVYWVRKVPCSAPHHGEVAGSSPIPDGYGDPYPGESAVRQRAAELCHSVLDSYALDQWAIPDGMDEVYLYPTSGNWKSGERYVTCAFEDRDAEHVGTVRTDRGSLTSAQLTYLEAVSGFNSAYAKQPKGEVETAASEYVTWAKQMASASRSEAEQLSRTTALWPEAAKPKVAALAAAQRDAAAAWDSAAKTADPTALAGEIRRAKLLTAKTTPLSVDARRELGLSTGEQAPDLRV
ncbi:DUF4190 domain-containing protein [Kitasatospora sp. NPDC093558]|uniref:DUF4190 domain-containing protein n=1 Tax=Kitasatospora sp. NPDC093558 TaxID=3155201 RepID=UPI00343B1649